MNEEYSRSLLKYARFKAGISQARLAQIADTYQSAISAIESGKSSPTMETLARLIGACGLEMRIGLEQPDTHESSRLAFQKMIDPALIAERERQEKERLEKIKRDRRNRKRRERRAATASQRNSSTRSNP